MEMGKLIQELETIEQKSTKAKKRKVKKIAKEKLAWSQQKLLVQQLKQIPPNISLALDDIIPPLL